jgi:hypothetical protein
MPGWTLDKNGVTPKPPLTASEQSNLNAFMGGVQNKGLSPSQSAKEAHITYKKLQGTFNQYEIYLSQGTRATFLVDEQHKKVTMKQVGGHT